MYMAKTMRKIITFILIVSYIVTFNGTSYAFGSKTLFQSTSHAQRHLDKARLYQDRDIAKSPALFSIPQGLGRIVEYHKGKGGRLVIHIQDRHIDPITQKNIASIIEILNTRYNVYLMCLEGASKELDTSFYDSFKDESLKARVAELFVEKSLFTGPEFYKITNSKNYLKAIGAENKETYLEHLNCYKDNQPHKSDMLKLVRSMAIAADALKRHVYTKDIQSIDKLSHAYSQKRTDFSEYLIRLKGYIEKSGTAIDAYPELNKFYRLMEQEAEIDFSGAEKEREALIKQLTEHLPKKGVQQLLGLSVDFRLNKISAVAFHEYLEGLIADFKPDKEGYHNLTAYIDYLEFSKTINYLKVFDETEEIEEAVQLALCGNAAQEKLVRYSKSLTMLKGLYEFKLTHRSLDYINNHKDYFDILKIERFLKDTSARYGLNAALSARSINLNREAVENSRRFYSLALERDIALTRNTLRYMSQYRKDKAVLVTGGFHTQGITNMLKEKGVSYIVICPAISLDDYDAVYEKRMAGITPGIGALKESFASMLSAPLCTGDAADKRLTENIRQGFREVYAFGAASGAQDPLSTKASSSGMGKRIVKYAGATLLTGATLAMLYSGYTLFSASMKSQQQAKETFGLQQELPSDQWQIILDTLREVYALFTDVDAPGPRNMAMKFHVGKVIRILRDYITNNFDKIHKYAKEQGIDANYLAAIILTEQMDINEFSPLRGPATDKLGPFFGRDTSRGPGQMQYDTFKQCCKGIRWQPYGKLTEELSLAETRDILYGKDMANHIRATAIILRAKRDSIKDFNMLSNLQGELQLGMLYTSSYRGRVNEQAEDICTSEQLTDSRTASLVYAHSVIIYSSFMRRWLSYHKYEYVPDKLSFVPSLGTDKTPPAKASSGGQYDHNAQAYLKALEEIVKMITEGIKEFQAQGWITKGGCLVNNGLLGWMLQNVIGEEVKLIARYKGNDEHWYLVIDKNIIVDIEPLVEYQDKIKGDILIEPLEKARKISTWYDVDPSEEMNDVDKKMADVLIANIMERDDILKRSVPVLSKKWPELLKSKGYKKEHLNQLAQVNLLTIDMVIDAIQQKTGKEVIAWLDKNNRKEELEEILSKYNAGEDVLLSADAKKAFLDILADFVIRKAREGADHIRPIDKTAVKPSAAGAAVLSRDLLALTQKAVNYHSASIYDPLSYLGLGRVTLITNARSLTEFDKQQLRKLATQNTGFSDDEPKKITIITVYDEAKAALKECGFTDTGERPSVLGIGDFGFLAGSLSRDWQDISQEERIAMTAASIRGQNRAVITITDDRIAEGIASAIPAYLNDRKKGKVVIASMQGATQKVMIGSDAVAENGIVFSVVLADALRQVKIRFAETADQQLFILNALPPIDSKAFKNFIRDLMDIKAAVDAASSAA